VVSQGVDKHALMMKEVEDALKVQRQVRIQGTLAVIQGTLVVI
jgi:hypothetical protein